MGEGVIVMKFGCQIGNWDDAPFEEVITIVRDLDFTGLELFEGCIASYQSNPNALLDLLKKEDKALSGIYFGSQDFLKLESNDESGMVIND